MESTMTQLLARLGSEIGARVQETRDTIHLGPAQWYRMTFDPAAPDLTPACQVPPGRHGLYFLPQLSKQALRPDGTPTGAGVIPDIPLPRRMFASEELEFHRPLYFGETLVRKTTLTDLRRKDGASGELVFATVRHDFGDAVTSHQHTVFRHEAKAAANAQGVPVGTGADMPSPRWRKSMVLDEVDLFRFSALTWNSHRIHYDAPWARQQEGYPDLVVHGPLLSMLMLDFGIQCLGTAAVKSYRMRALSSVFANRPFELLADESDQGVEVRAVDEHGNVAMRGSLSA